MQLKDAIKARYSIRKYLSKEVPLKVVIEMLETAKLAPSAGNLQNWRVVIVTEPEVKEKIAQACLEQYWMTEASVLLVICNDKEIMKKHYGKRGLLYGIQNCAVFASYLQLLAIEQNIGTAWVGAFDVDAVKRILKIPETVNPEIILTLGYQNEKKFKRERAPVEYFCFFEQYGNKLIKKQTKQEKLRKRFGKDFRIT